MSKPDRSQRLFALLEPLVNEQDLYLEEVTIQHTGDHRIIQVVVDLPENRSGSVALDTIAEVSQLVGAALDDDPEDDGRAYDLEVSSPGVSRPLTELRHWRRALGHIVRVNLFEGDNPTARLVGVEDDGVTIREERIVKKGMKPKILDPVFIEFSKIRRGNVEVEFARLDAVEPYEPAGDESGQKGQD
ncbi:ribosome maturation factor RimP [Psychromicrobium lacuslunae]|uniref:ribosome maturation factor RimP n=1 Tax=Psychromicrobium lacuslunae TaxID=1618207 RepID=UPI000A4C8A4D|nr:ribosome maturation factor RimP [Psychromicrobium lacuslunae]